MRLVDLGGGTIYVFIYIYQNTCIEHFTNWLEISSLRAQLVNFTTVLHIFKILTSLLPRGQIDCTLVSFTLEFRLEIISSLAHLKCGKELGFVEFHKAGK